MARNHLHLVSPSESLPSHVRKALLKMRSPLGKFAMTSNGRISLNDRLQREWFEKAMATLKEHYDHLSDFDRRLYNDLESGYQMVGRAMTVTRKQMNHLKQSAFEYDRGA